MSATIKVIRQEGMEETVVSPLIKIFRKDVVDVSAEQEELPANNTTFIRPFKKGASLMPPKTETKAATEETNTPSIEEADAKSVTSLPVSSELEARKKKVHWLEIGIITASVVLLGVALFMKDQKEQKEANKQKEVKKASNTDSDKDKENLEGIRNKKKTGSRKKYTLQGFKK